MTPAALLALVVKYGPSIVPIVKKLVVDAKGGDKPISDADWAELDRLAALAGEGLYRSAGVVPPL